MSRVIIKSDKWFPIADGDRLPIIECPECERYLMGNSPHGIKENGEVYASIVCAHEGCDFHEFVTLENYNLGEIPHK